MVLVSGRKPVKRLDLIEEQKMTKAHSAQGTVKQLTAILSSMADGILMNPANEDQARAAIVLKHRAFQARTHHDVALAAVSASYCLKKAGDLDGHNNIMDLFEGRTQLAVR